VVRAAAPRSPAAAAARLGQSAALRSVAAGGRRERRRDGEADVAAIDGVPSCNAQAQSRGRSRGERADRQQSTWPAINLQ
jgi:hypothetical protein